MNHIKIHDFEEKDEKVEEYESYYNAFIACYWIMMIVTIHFLFRFLNVRDHGDNNPEMRIMERRGPNMWQEMGAGGDNRHRRFIENLDDEDLGSEDDTDDEFDSRGL